MVPGEDRPVGVKHAEAHGPVTGQDSPACHRINSVVPAGAPRAPAFCVKS
jgi:hypothetical protein